MDQGAPTPRRTCTSCRKWFDPKPSASKTQRTCSPLCRTRRRAMLARQRREGQLHESRVAERERQQACRGRRLSEGPRAPPRRVLSRATLSPEMAGILEQIEAAVDHEARRSRASLARHLRAIVGEKPPIVDQAGP